VSPGREGKVAWRVNRFHSFSGIARWLWLTYADYVRTFGICGLLVFAVTFALFSPGLSHDFLNWDDTGLVVNAREIQSLKMDAIVRMFSSYCASNYTPLERLSYAIDYQLWGMEASGFCLTNILLHSINTFLLFLLAFQIFSRAFADPHSRIASHCTGNTRLCLAAGCAALAFGIHPLRVESVTWIAERRDVLSLFWCLLCVLFYLKWVEAPTGSSGRSWLGLTTWIFFACSLLSKAVGVTLPLVLLLLDFYPLRRFAFSRGSLARIFHHSQKMISRCWMGIRGRGAIYCARVGGGGRNELRPYEKIYEICRPGPLGRCILEKIPYVALSLAAGWVAILGQSHRGAVISMDAYPWSARIPNAFVAIAFYAHKWVFPFPLHPIYSKAPRDTSFFEPDVLLSMMLMVLISAWSISSIRRRPGLVVAWWSYVIMIMPFTGLLQVGNPFAADRYTYFSMIPFAILMGSGLCHLPGHASSVAGMAIPKMARGLIIGVVSIALGGWGVLTVRQIDIWRDSLVFWPYVQQEVPNEFNPLNNYSTTLIKHGDYFLAYVMLRETTRLRPRWDVGWYNYGIASTLTGREEQAIRAFRQNLRLNPWAGDAHLALGNLLFIKHEIMEARRHYFASLQDQMTADCLTHLAMALYETRQPELAIKYLSWAAMERHPRAYLVWARILMSQSQTTEAISILRLGYDMTHDPEIRDLHTKLMRMNPPAKVP